MGILETFATSCIPIFGVACYSPELRDCTITCNTASDCAAGQVCSSDNFCAAPDTSCSVLPGDAGMLPGRDADITIIPIDAAPDAPPDAPRHAILHITIEGKGQVAVQGVGTCDAAAPQNGDCDLLVPINVATTLHAAGYSDWEFDRWTTAPCAVVQSSTCTFVFEAALQVGTKFKRGDDD